MPTLYDIDVDINFRVSLPIIREEDDLEPDQLRAILFNTPQGDLAEVIANSTWLRLDIYEPDIWNTQDADGDGRYKLNTTTIEEGFLGATSLNEHGEVDYE